MKNQYTRKKSGKKQQEESNWKTIQINGSGRLIVGTVDEEIMKQMPVTTETFIERGKIDSFINRVQIFLRTGK